MAEIIVVDEYGKKLIERYRIACEGGDSVGINRITEKLRKRGINVASLGVKAKVSGAAKKLTAAKDVDPDKIRYTD
jgi:repressor of nif and glnA expression